VDAKEQLYELYVAMGNQDEAQKYSSVPAEE
jgi:hypothetical protein